MKQIVVESESNPAESGYRDRIAVIDIDGIVYHDACSACPNPHRPWPHTHVLWPECYGWLAPGKYGWRCIRHWKRGKCLLVNEGGECPSRNANPNHGGRFILTEIFIHRGWTMSWRGSAGCVTIPPATWRPFIDCFSVGDAGELAIVDFTKMSPATCARAGHCPLYREV